MKQYAVEYWGFMTILAESEEEAKAKFAEVDHGEMSDYAEIRTIDYMCEVYKGNNHWKRRLIERMWNRLLNWWTKL